MARLKRAYLQESRSAYDLPRDEGEVLVEEDTAHLLIEVSVAGDDTTLQSLLSQQQSIQTMLETPDCIYWQSRPRQGPDNVRQVLAMPMSTLERALNVASQNGHAGVVSILLDFATQQGVDHSNVITRSMITKAIHNGHAAVLEVLGYAQPDIIHFSIDHGTRPLYEAVKQGQTDVVAVLLELGADPLHPVPRGKILGSYNLSLMSFAAMSEGPRMIEMLLNHGVPIAQTGAIHTAAQHGNLDTMRLLMQHGANVNEVLLDWLNQTPMHFAANEGQIDAMKLLKQSGARSDVKDAKGKTPAQLLKEHTIA